MQRLKRIFNIILAVTLVLSVFMVPVSAEVEEVVSASIPYETYVYDYDGNRIEVPSRRHVGSHSKWYNRMQGPFREAGALKEGKFGDAKVFLLEARKAGDIVYELLKKEPLFFTDEFHEGEAPDW